MSTLACHKKLKSIEINNDTIQCIWTISHNNYDTTLEQDLKLIKTPLGWKAYCTIDQFPDGIETPNEAALKLAEWFSRLSIAINNNKFESININKIK